MLFKLSIGSRKKVASLPRLARFTRPHHDPELTFEAGRQQAWRVLAGLRH